MSVSSQPLAGASSVPAENSAAAGRSALESGDSIDLRLDEAADPSDLLDRYLDVRATTERLAEPLSAEDQIVQSMPDVSPTKWHRAHVTWFFETFLVAPNTPGYDADPVYGYLFNSYYEAVGERHPRPERGLISRPTVRRGHGIPAPCGRGASSRPRGAMRGRKAGSSARSGTSVLARHCITSSSIRSCMLPPTSSMSCRR